MRLKKREKLWRVTFPFDFDQRKKKNPMALPGIGIFGTGPVVKLIVPFLQKKGFRVEALWSLTLQGLFFIFNTDKQIAILFAIS